MRVNGLLTSKIEQTLNPYQPSNLSTFQLPHFDRAKRLTLVFATYLHLTNYPFCFKNEPDFALLHPHPPYQPLYLPIN